MRFDEGFLDFDFDNDQKVTLEQTSISATLGKQVDPRWGVLGSLGVITGGTVNFGSEGDVSPGVLASGTLTWLPVYETPSRPFVSTSFTLGLATATAVSDDTMEHRWTAADMRAGAMVGKTFFDHIVPYAIGRVFMGPVFWKLNGENVMGRSATSVAFGAGTTIRIPGTMDLFVEALPLGEQSASLGGIVAF